MDYKKFFTEDNKSGIKTKESYISKNYPDLYLDIVNYINEVWFIDLSFKEKVWYYINGIINKIKCCNCRNYVTFKGNLNKGYNKYCSLKCANDSGDLTKLAKESTIKKYGVDSTNKLDYVKTKKKKTFIDKYGVDNPMKNQEIKNKHRDSLIKNNILNL